MFARAAKCRRGRQAAPSTSKQAEKAQQRIQTATPCEPHHPSLSEDAVVSEGAPDEPEPTCTYRTLKTNIVESLSGLVAEHIVPIDVTRDIRAMQNGRPGASNGTRACIQNPPRVAEPARSMKVCLLAVRLRQDNLLDNPDDARRKYSPRKLHKRGGKHDGSTARHTGHELAQHNLGTRVT